MMSPQDRAQMEAILSTDLFGMVVRRPAGTSPAEAFGAMADAIDARRGTIAADLLSATRPTTYHGPTTTTTPRSTP